MEKHHSFSIGYVILGVWLVLILHDYLAGMLTIRSIPYGEFLSLQKQHKISKVAIGEGLIQGRLADGDGQGKGILFKTVRVDPEISKLLEEYHVTFKGEVESTFLRDLFSWVFPVLFFFGIRYFLFQKMAGKQPGFMSLGKKKARVYKEEKIDGDELGGHHERNGWGDIRSVRQLRQIRLAGLRIRGGA